MSIGSSISVLKRRVEKVENNFTKERTTDLVNCITKRGEKQNTNGHMKERATVSDKEQKKIIIILLKLKYKVNNKGTQEILE